MTPSPRGAVAPQSCHFFFATQTPASGSLLHFVPLLRGSRSPSGPAEQQMRACRMSPAVPSALRGARHHPGGCTWWGTASNLQQTFLPKPPTLTFRTTAQELPRPRWFINHPKALSFWGEAKTVWAYQTCTKITQQFQPGGGSPLSAHTSRCHSSPMAPKHCLAFSPCSQRSPGTA